MIDSLLAIEIEPDPDGHHAIVIDLGDDSILFISDSCQTPQQAVNAARSWAARTLDLQEKRP